MSGYDHHGGGGGYRQDRDRDRGRDPYRRDDRGGDYSRERSRSRDYAPGGRGGGGYPDRGGYGRGPPPRGGMGGGGRGGRGPRRPPHPRPAEMMVRTNFFPLEFVRTDGLDIEEYVQYDVEIFDAMRVKKKDGEGKVIEPWEFQVIPMKPRKGKEMKIDLKRGSVPLSRRILMKLWMDEREKDSTFCFAFDGGSIAVAPRRLFEKGANEVAIDEEGKSEPGKYGPSDDGGHSATQAPDVTRKTFEVKVKRECEENDPEADRVKNAYYLVRFTEVCVVSGNEVAKMFQPQIQEFAQLEQVRQCMDIILKSAQLSVGMVALGRSPRVFYFDEKIQSIIARDTSRTLSRILNDRHKREALYVGLKQSVEHCENGGVYIVADSAVDFVNREVDAQNQQIPIIDEQRREIAGIKIDLSRPIDDEHIRAQIKAKLERLTFHVKYVREPSPEFLQRMRDKGKTDSQIRRLNTVVRRNKTLKLDSRRNASIVWRADDPEQHSFDVYPRRRKNEEINTEEKEPEPVKHTVASYFRDIKQLRLRFPHLPIVYIGGNEWFPLEFLTQAFGKTRAANSSYHVKDVLSYHDENAGMKSVENIQTLMRKCASLEQWGLRFDDILQQFGLRKKDEPLSVKAKILAEPTLKFHGNVEAELRNGSWDLRNKKFSSPGDILSFAAISLARRGKPVEEFLGKLFSVSELTHGMTLPANTHYMDPVSKIIVTAPPSQPNQIVDKVGEAIENSKCFFLYDAEGTFRGKKVWFKTKAVSPDGDLVDCLIIPPPSRDLREVGLILPQVSDFMATHKVVNRLDPSMTAVARIMVMVQGEPRPVDPFHFRFKFDTRQNRPSHQVKRSDGSWVDANFLKYVYMFENGDITEESDIRPDPEPVIIVSESEVECPSVLFAYLEDDSKEAYNVIKMATHFFHGVQSQCAVAQKFSNQRNPDQYCSNIALKLNAKMANASNRARAWNTFFSVEQQLSEDLPWVKEIPTLVLGLGSSKGIGEDAISVIGASAALDPGCMHIAQEMKIQVKKSQLISAQIMQDIVQSLLAQFYQHNKVWPKRILYFREGVSQGESDQVKDHEMGCIRKACYELLSRTVGIQCANEEKCHGHGCMFCTPLITFVVCHTQSNVKIVLNDPQDGFSGGRGNNTNVLSGTCVDRTIVESKKSISDSDDQSTSETLQVFSGVEDCGRDFVLTAHGGLKGTSKPIVYSAHPNENLRYYNEEGASPLTREVLELATYHMSYQYGTATKAVRSVPVLYYSKRLAELGMGYVNYLRGRKAGSNSHLVSVSSDDDDNGEITFIRDEMQAISFEDVRRTELLPHFGPFGEKGFRSPFRTHLSA